MVKEKTSVMDLKFRPPFLLSMIIIFFALGWAVGVQWHECDPQPPHYENYKMGDEDIIKFFYEGQVYYNTRSPRGPWSDVNGDTVARNSDWRIDQDDLNCGLDKILQRDKALRLVEAAGK